MPTPTLTRGQFMVGCSAAIAAMAGASIQSLAFANPLETGTGGDILVVIFLRGAWDALNVAPPISGADRGFYEAARPHIGVPTVGTYRALSLDGHFGFHPAMAPLMDIYRHGHLAVVHAVGMNDNTRSHFDAQEFLEAGTPGLRNTPTGWITRHLQTLPHETLLFPALSTGGSTPNSLLGFPDAVSMTSPSAFRLPGDDVMASLVGGVNEGDTWLHKIGQRTVQSVSAVQRLSLNNYVPARGVAYPDGEFGQALQTIAQMMKSQFHLQAATIDVGGWDTHQYQGDGGQGYFSSLLGDLALGLSAFYHDLDASNLSKRVTVVTMSEFGRRLNQNASGGTDHGHGSAMLVMGGHSVIGGRVYGRWPGLGNTQLYDHADLAVTTDYRQVLSEVLGQRFHNNHLDVVFPGFTAGPHLGLIRP